MVVHSSSIYLFVYVDSMFDLRYLTSHRQPMMKQLDKLHREGLNGGPNFLTWFREHVNPNLFLIYILFYNIIFTQLTKLVGS
jgi:hypothetical protein